MACYGPKSKFADVCGEQTQGSRHVVSRALLSWMGWLVMWQGERVVWWCGLAGDVAADEGGVVVWLGPSRRVRW
jgi:hypothetical protein